MKEKRGIRSAFRNTMIVALLACVMALVPSVAAHAKFENYSEGGTSTNNDHTGRYSGLSRSYLIDGKDGGFLWKTIPQISAILLILRRV